MTESQDENTRPDTDLRDHLHQMEAKVRKLKIQETTTMSKLSVLLNSEMLYRLNTKSIVRS